MLSVGEILKKERERRNLKISEIAQKIRIREKFLLAIEANDWSQFSSKIYITGIIKNYSSYLSLDHNRTLAIFRRDYARIEEVKFKRKVASKYLTPETKRALIFLVIFIFGLFFAYFGYQLKVYFSPPAVKIISPKSTLVEGADMIKVVGKADRDSAVTVLGERVYQNKEGIFEYDFPLKLGKNNLIIEVVGANGKKTILKSEYTKK